MYSLLKNINKSSIHKNQKHKNHTSHLWFAQTDKNKHQKYFIQYYQAIKKSQPYHYTEARNYRHLHS